MDCISAGPALFTNSVWYTYTVASSGALRVMTAGSEYDTVVGIYTGLEGSLGPVACDDDGGTGLLSSECIVIVPRMNIDNYNNRVNLVRRERQSYSRIY